MYIKNVHQKCTSKMYIKGEYHSFSIINHIPDQIMLLLARYHPVQNQMQSTMLCRPSVKCSLKVSSAGKESIYRYIWSCAAFHINVPSSTLTYVIVSRNPSLTYPLYVHILAPSSSSKTCQCFYFQALICRIPHSVS